jgi:hypothetical protein
MRFIVTLKVEAAHPSETFVKIYHTYYTESQENDPEINIVTYRLITE